MRLSRLGLMAATLLASVSLHSAASARSSKVSPAAKGVTVSLVETANPSAVLARIDVVPGLVAEISNTATFGYVASVAEMKDKGKSHSRTVMTPGEVQVGYKIRASISEPHHGQPGLSISTTASTLGKNGFIPVNDFKRDFQSFSSDSGAIELPNISSIANTDTATVNTATTIPHGPVTLIVTPNSN